MSESGEATEQVTAAGRARRAGPGRAPRRRRLLLLVGLALGVRLVHLSFAALDPTFAAHRSFAESDMYLFDAWAQKIAGGDLLGREVYHPLAKWQVNAVPAETWQRWYGTAPTYYKAPLYPYLVALLYALFTDAMLPLAILQCLASTLAVVLLYRVGERLFGPTAGFLGAVLYALYAPAIHYDAVMLRGPFIVLVSLAVTWQLLRLEQRPTGRGAVALGLLAGALVLLNEGSVLTLPLLAAVLAWWLRKQPRRLGAVAAGLFAGLAIAVLPVVVRNLLVGSPPLQLAVTGGTVYAVFNTAGTSPWFFQTKANLFRTILERADGALGMVVVECLRSFEGPWEAGSFYLKKFLGLLIPYESPDNANFYYAGLRSPVVAWLPAYGVLCPLGLLGMGLSARSGGKRLALLPAALPLLVSIFVTIALSRYRATLVVFLFPFAGLALAHAWGWARSRATLPLGLATAGVLLFAGVAFAVERKVVFEGKPPGAFYYRPAEFDLAEKGYEARGQLDLATDVTEELLARNPDPRVRTSALFQVAWLRILRGQRDGGRRAIDEAVALSGQDPLVLLVAGDLLRDSLGDGAAALALYRTALDRGPPPELAAKLRRALEQTGAPAPKGPGR